MHRCTIYVVSGLSRSPFVVQVKKKIVDTRGISHATAFCYKFCFLKISVKRQACSSYSSLFPQSTLHGQWRACFAQRKAFPIRPSIRKCIPFPRTQTKGNYIFIHNWCVRGVRRRGMRDRGKIIQRGRESYLTSSSPPAEREKIPFSLLRKEIPHKEMVSHTLLALTKVARTQVFFLL